MAIAESFGNVLYSTEMRFEKKFLLAMLFSYQCRYMSALISIRVSLSISFFFCFTSVSRYHTPSLLFVSVLIYFLLLINEYLPAIRTNYCLYKISRELIRLHKLILYSIKLYERHGFLAQQNHLIIQIMDILGINRMCWT